MTNRADNCLDAGTIRNGMENSLKRNDRKETKDGRPQDATPPAGAIANAATLKLLVFVAGAVVMGLEIAGSRVLAPFFGNSVFVWGSLISVFLVALTIGYYGGGKLADARPSGALLGGICIAVSLWILGIAVTAHWFCGLLADAGFGEQSGPLAAALALFLAPSIGMGIVSPFAIRLMAQSVATLGKTSGSLYALSTLGSIAGTMATTFVLVPAVGVSTILKLLAGCLLVAAVIVVVTWGDWRKQRAPVAAALAIAVALSTIHASRVGLEASETLLADVDTAYHHISVIDHAGYDMRELRFDRFVESAIRRSPPHQSLSNYTDSFHLAFLLKPDIKRTVFIGAGGGIGPREFHAHNPDMDIDVVDIDPKVLELAQRYFFLANSPRIRTIAKDGRMFLRNSTAVYDCIVLDAFTIGGRIPFHLVTAEFFALCQSRLAPDGVFVMNINSAIDGPLASIYRSMHRTLASVFPQTYAFAKDLEAVGANRSMNVILVASRDDRAVSASVWQERARRHYSRSNVAVRELENAVKGLLVNPPDRSTGALFADDYSPIETMAF